MNKKAKRRIITLSMIALLFGSIWINNTCLFQEQSEGYRLLAHRGLAQTFDVTTVEWDTNTAEIIYEPEHPYLENTIASMQAAFDCGADIVELDIQATKDQKLAVFHDYDLSMRTEAQGNICDYTMEELKLLDIGYGYTADHGNTYPFRGKGIGLMPELKEVLEVFPDRELLIHMKQGGLEEATVLWTYLEKMPEERLANISVYGENDGIQYLREQHPTLKLMSKKQLKKALLAYELLGWTGYIPSEIRNMELHIPLMYAKLLWGWPNKFVDRMEKVNTRVVIVDGSGKWSEGFDSIASLERIPKGYDGYIWTNRVDVISQQPVTSRLSSS